MSRPPTASDRHTPVMLAEVLDAIAPAAGQHYIDATFGAGGYSRAILASASCRLIGVDRDPDAVVIGRQLEADSGGRFTMLDGAFGSLESLLTQVDFGHADGVVFDLGVSSPQLNDANRGFSFSDDGPLDMRMSQSGRSAAEFINTASEETLAEIIRSYGEERFARRIARAIVRARTTQPIERTAQLASVVAGAVPSASSRRQQIHPATRTFQAVRIYVNDELDELRRGLAAAERLLVKGGRLVVVAFHSLEDRIVKDFLGLRSGRGPGVARHRPEVPMPAPTFELPYRRPRRPAESEINVNPRARSARLRAGVRTAAPAWQVEATA